MTYFYRSLVVLATVFVVGCGYSFGPKDRSIPGGYKKIAVPIFKNKSQEVGAELSFTNSLLQEFQRSKVADVVPESMAEAIIRGEITSIKYTGQGNLKAGVNNTLPLDTVLAAEYLINLEVSVVLVRAVDGKVLWQSVFRGEKTYYAPQITRVGLNSANPLYNLSSRRQNIDLMALDLMAEAYGRITENF
ncbi:MAG: LptE family protein [Pseudobdellovibrionaceae bacterium]